MATRGPAPSSRRQLNPSFVAVVRASDRPLYALGQLAGWRSGRELGYLTLPSALAAQTPLTVARLQCLAAILGYQGDLFAPDDDGAPVVRA